MGLLNTGDYVTAIGDAIFSPFKDLITLIFYDIGTVILVIFMLILFFVAQYWLLKLYFYIGKAVTGTALKGYAFVVSNPKFKKYIADAEDLFTQ